MFLSFAYLAFSAVLKLLLVRRLWGAKTLFTAGDHPDLQAESSADAPRV